MNTERANRNPDQGFGEHAIDLRNRRKDGNEDADNQQDRDLKQ